MALNSPLILYTDTGPGGLRVTACCRAAAAAGVTPGMRLAEAEGLWTPQMLRSPRGPRFVTHDLDADREALVRLAEWCQRFTPLVGIAGVDTLRLDVTGCAHLFGGEWGLARRVLHDFRRCGLRVQIGLADTIGTAWAVAHHGAGVHSIDRFAESRRRPPVVDESAVDDDPTDGKRIANFQLQIANCKFEISDIKSEVSRRLPALCSERESIRIVPSGEQQHALIPLPIEALRLPQQTVALLHTLSLRRIGQLLALPRATLPARFGPELLQRIDQALGRADEPIVAVRPQPPVSAHWTLPAPTADRCALANAVGRLIRQVAERLAARREGVQALEVRFTHSTGPATALRVGTVQPTAESQHLLNLALTQLDQIQLDDEVLSVTVVAQSIASLSSHQPQLLESALPQKNRRALAQLADRLTTRLGQDHVVQPVLHADPQPELAVQWQRGWHDLRAAMVVGCRHHRNHRNRRKIANCRLQIANCKLEKHEPPGPFGFRISDFAVRPLQLLPDPEPIAVECTAGSPVRVTRGGRVHDVVACRGSERIETGWWRGADVQRDYFRIETAEGLRLWIFRSNEQQYWFLHGEFD